LPDAVVLEPTAQPGWTAASRAYPAFAVSQFVWPAKQRLTRSSGNPEGGRKDVFRWSAQAEKPVAELEIYRPGPEFDRSGPASADMAARNGSPGERELGADITNRPMRSRSVEFRAAAIDLELGDRLFSLRRPAEDVLAAAFGMPEDLVSLCFAGQIELADGKRRVGARRRRPARLGGRLQHHGIRQLVPQMDAGDGKQGQSPHIGYQARQRAAAFIEEAAKRRMNLVG